MWSRLRRRTYEILEGTRSDDRVSQVVQWFIITLIILNVAAVVLATVDSLHDPYERFYTIFELVSVIVFSLEYVLRVWASIERPGFDRPIIGRLRFMITPAALIDLIAILPFFIPRVTGPGLDLRAIRALRLFRLFRLLKLGHYSASIRIFTDVLRGKWEQIVLAGLSVGVLLVLASSLMYFAENAAQPEKFANIPKAMWWGVITLTTVGYGDVYPVTTLGKVLGGVISLLGIGLFALPAGILASGFEEAMDRRQEYLHGDDDDEEAEGESDGEAEEAAQAQQGRAERANGTAEEDWRYCPCCGRPMDEANATEEG